MLPTQKLNRFPFRYGMRYMAKVLKATLTEKFPDASEEEIYKVWGGGRRGVPGHKSRTGVWPLLLGSALFPPFKVILAAEFLSQH